MQGHEKAKSRHLEWTHGVLVLLFLLFVGATLISTGVVGAAREGQSQGTWRATLIPVRRCTLTTPQVGLIKKFHLEEGQACAAGQVIVELECRQSSLQVCEAEAVLAAARAGLTRAQGEAESLETLYACENTTYRKLKLARAEVEIAKARCQEADARLAQAKFKYSQCSIKAPFAGRLLARRCEPGEAVKAFGAICDLIDNQSLFAVIQVNQAELKGLKIGTRVYFHQQSGQVHVGQVDRVGVQLNPGSRKLRVRVRILNRGEHLWAGDSGRVTLEKE